MQTIKKLIYKAIDEINEQLEDDRKVELSDDTCFIGKKACLDSISFVTFISILEELIEEKLDKNIQIVNEKAFSEKNSPFYSVETLCNYIQSLISEE